MADAALDGKLQHMGHSAVVGRLAPSPTGQLHLGHAFAFLLSYWSARSQGGSVILRLEDVDAERASEQHCNSAVKDLAWLGLEWDGPPILQSSRIQELRSAATRLESAKHAYACVCTRGEIREASAAQSFEEEAGAPQQGQRETPYPGTCLGRFSSLREAELHTGRDAGLRFRITPGDTRFRDRVFGEQKFQVSSTAGDFLILRRNKTPSYQLAVVVDDELDGVTEVVRGRDLLESSARQLQLAEALGLPQPNYAHLPLVCDHQGRRLAKRADDLSIRELREGGVSPQAIRDWAARSACQARPERCLTEHFDWNQVPQKDVLLPEEPTSLFR